MKKPTIHASCVVIDGHGVLLRGASGAGKSRLALHFIDTAAQHHRFARLVGDDRIYLTARDGRLIASVPQTIAGLVERRRPGLRHEGIESVDYLASWPVTLVVDIISDAEIATLPFGERSATITLEGVSVPSLAVPGNLAEAVEQIEAFLALL